MQNLSGRISLVKSDPLKDCEKPSHLPHTMGRIPQICYFHSAQGLCYNRYNMIKATHATTQSIRSVATSPDVLVGQNIITKVSPGASVTSGPLRAVKLPFFTQIQGQRN